MVRLTLISVILSLSTSVCHWCSTSKLPFLQETRLKNPTRKIFNVDQCPQDITNAVHNLTSTGVSSPRGTNFSGYVAPYVLTALVFQTEITPQYVISIPVHFAENYVRKSLIAALKYTVGVWAIDIVVDFSFDQSLGIVLDTLRFFVEQRSREITCRSACSLLKNNTCQSISIPSRIRVILSRSPLWECKADNLVFSSTINKEAAYYISLQADNIVEEEGWNHRLAIPLRLWPDVFSVSGNCAHNNILLSPSNSVGRCNATRPVNLLQFEIRESSNRGPLMYRGSMMRAIGFFDERNFLNGNDDHDLHARAVMFAGFTGYYPVAVRNAVRNKTEENIRHAQIYGALPIMFNMNMTDSALKSFISGRDGGFSRRNFKGIPPAITRNRSKIVRMKLRLNASRDETRCIHSRDLLHSELNQMCELSRISSDKLNICGSYCAAIATS
jgi:hypothetical protein